MSAEEHKVVLLRASAGDCDETSCRSLFDYVSGTFPIAYFFFPVRPRNSASPSEFIPPCYRLRRS